jgi:hypothetical protein
MSAITASKKYHAKFKMRCFSFRLKQKGDELEQEMCAFFKDLTEKGELKKWLTVKFLEEKGR